MIELDEMNSRIVSIVTDKSTNQLLYVVFEFDGVEFAAKVLTDDGMPDVDSTAYRVIEAD